MAEPIRKTALPVHRRPLGVRPHPRPRPLRTAVPEPRPLPAAAPAQRPRPAPAAAPEESAAAEVGRSRSQIVQPVPRKKLRQVLQAVLGLHLAAAVLLFAFPSAGQPSGLSDALLATAVLLAGGTVLAFASSGRRV